MLTTKYQSRPIIVDAVQVNETNTPAVQAWLKTVVEPAVPAVPAKPAVPARAFVPATATTPAQPAVAAQPAMPAVHAVPVTDVPPLVAGDWVVRDSFRRIFVLSNEMFHLTFDTLRTG